MKSISVVLPAYNEEKNITECVESIYKYLKKNFRKFEIIVVDGESTDGTVRNVQQLMKKYRGLRLIKSLRGYGIQLRKGFLNAKYELIFYTDSDNQYDIKELDKLLKLIDRYDIVAGYRLQHSDPLTRIAISWTYNQMIRWLLGLKIKDVDCSFKIYKKEVFKNIDLVSNTGLIDAEVLIKAKKKGYAIGQVGVNHYPRTQGKSIYEIGKRNKILALVSPVVPLNIFKEIKASWKDLH